MIGPAVYSYIYLYIACVYCMCNRPAVSQPSLLRTEEQDSVDNSGLLLFHFTLSLFLDHCCITVFSLSVGITADIF